ncbi:group II truncated hemoglobin [Couchioplanes caeruleus]|uniref:group II truncated hemoglobin n=1 Tax=Couchioplanes caeruleus TaxID=56438 RepID=UPI0020C16738|nr:group II truncated hemoglobin [Couchioplanes caeruleus]UQU61437.1 group II truncated hemoglobin [Couchioplanes caeruleus]
MTLYDAVGGAPALLALAADFHARCLADPVLEHPFSHTTNPEHVQRLADYWGEVFGGPPVYSASYGGHSAMLGLHANQGAEDDLGDRFVACFVAAVDSTGVTSDPAVRAALVAYMRWATDEVMTYSPMGSRVPAGLPVPRWTLDGLQR